MKGLAASTGQEGGPEADKHPFISGTFEYGVGRPAAKRKVCMLVHALPVSLGACHLCPHQYSHVRD